MLAEVFLAGSCEQFSSKVAVMTMPTLYHDTLRKLLADGTLTVGDRVLVACGGPLDREELLALGFSNVTISNLDERMLEGPGAAQFAPYDWDYQDVEELSYSDDSFDLVVAHSGLHHCRQPTKALTEMYRVARRHVLVFEPKDGWFSRFAIRFGFGQDYELSAVAANDLKFGGVRNTKIPNYVFRWTPRIVECVIQSYRPEVRNRIQVFYALQANLHRLKKFRVRALYWLASGCYSILYRAGKCFPCLANNLGFLISKGQSGQDLQPWLRQTEAGIDLNLDWFQREYPSVTKLMDPSTDGNDETFPCGGGGHRPNTQR